MPSKQDNIKCHVSHLHPPPPPPSLDPQEATRPVDHCCPQPPHEVERAYTHRFSY